MSIAFALSPKAYVFRGIDIAFKCARQSTEYGYKNYVQ